MTIRAMALVKLTPEYRDDFSKTHKIHSLPRDKYEYYTSFYKEENLIFVGEIVNMPGHGIFIGASGKIYSGFHLDNFIELSDDEV